MFLRSGAGAGTRRPDAAKAGVDEARVGTRFHACARPVAAAQGGAQVRAASLDAHGYVGLVAIPATHRTARVHGEPPPRPSRICVGPVPVVNPLPDVAGHVEEPV